MRAQTRWICLFGMVLAAGCTAVQAQSASQVSPAVPIPGTGEVRSPDDVVSTTLPKSTEEKMANDRNLERQKRLVQDTDRLLALATQLKAEVDKTDQHILSIEVVKKAEEIERLAKSVKERMKG